MTRDELLARLAGLRQARVGAVRVPHKPLLLLWLFGQFAATGSSAASYQQTEEPVSQLINDFGPPVASASVARQRAAMPFVHLERELWDLRDAAGNEIAPDAPERRAWLLEQGAAGHLRPPVERLLADAATLAAAARLLLDLHFTPVLAELICAAVDLDVAALDLAGSDRISQTHRLQPRRRGFAEEVLRAYAYQCAMCGFDGALGHYPVGIEAAHVRWYSQRGPDEVTNALALCALHHALFDLGVLGITEERRIRVSSLYVARNDAGRAVDALAGKPPTDPAAAPANGGRRVHLLASPAGLQRAPWQIAPSGAVEIYDRRMAFWDAVQARHIRQAAAEYDELGQDEFLARYGFGRARAYLLIIDDKAYDSKAILGVAYRHATGQPLGPEDFSGGAVGAARVLRSLGFEVRVERNVVN